MRFKKLLLRLIPVVLEVQATPVGPSGQGHPEKDNNDYKIIYIQITKQSPSVYKIQKRQTFEDNHTIKVPKLVYYFLIHLTFFTSRNKP